MVFCARSNKLGTCHDRAGEGEFAINATAGSPAVPAMNFSREVESSPAAAVHILYDAPVRCRADIDAMENAIRNVRTTASSQSEKLVCQSGAPWTPNRRCNLLETSSYVSMRLTLLRNVMEFENQNACDEDDDWGDGSAAAPAGSSCCQGKSSREKNEAVCHIGSGISVRATFPSNCSGNSSSGGSIVEKEPPHVRIVWKLSESDGYLPSATTSATKVQPQEESDDDEDASLWAMGGRVSNTHKRKLGS